MFAALKGHSGAVRVLLNKDANVSVVGDGSMTALHISAQEGHLAVSKMLVEAGADLEAVNWLGYTPLTLAAGTGHVGLMNSLIEAGANPNSRGFDGATPLFMAAQEGHKDAIKMLLRAKGNPLLARTDESGLPVVPLDIAASNGHLEVVRELVQQFGIEGCGGASGGLNALTQAAISHHLDVMTVLADAGVVDDGRALAAAFGAAAGYGRELAIKFLLQQRKDGDAAYVNSRDCLGGTPLLYAMGLFDFSSRAPRIVRLLVDAGADTTSAVRVRNREGTVQNHGTPLDLATEMLRAKEINGKVATEDQLNRLEGIRRLLLRVEAVHAISFLWPVDVPFTVGTAEGTSRKVATSSPLRRMLPMLRRRARRPQVLLAALDRYYCIDASA